MFINPRNYKKCFACKGVGKTDNNVCNKCGGYGSIVLKVVMTELRKTNEGKR